MMHKKCLFSVLFAFLFVGQGVLADMSFKQDWQLSRVAFPEKNLIDKEIDNQWYARVQRNATLTLSALVFVGALYATFKAGNFFSGLDLSQKQQAEDHLVLRLLMEHNKDKLSVPQVTIPHVSTPVVAHDSIGWIDKGVQRMSSFFSSIGSVIAQGSPTVLAGIVLNGVNDQFTKAVQAGSVERSVQWYVQHQTKLLQILKDLEVYTVGYDIHSPVLQIDTLQKETNVHIKQFVQDLTRLAKDQKQDNFLGEDYLTYLFEQVKKNYVKKSGELEKLQDLAVHAQGEQSEDIFKRDRAHRQDIAELCQLLIQEIQSVTVFVLALYHNQQSAIIGCAGHEQKLMDLVATTNAYLETMESLLNADSKTLKDISINGQGMFTCTYEFGKIVKQQLEHIHNYCAITG